jgi:ATP-binding protein involved in chromosome partitioning
LVTEEQVRAALHEVRDPEIGRPIDDLGMLAGVAIEGERVTVDVLLTASRTLTCGCRP